MVDRAEFRVQRNRTLKAGTMGASSLDARGVRRAMSPHNSGRPPQQVSDQKCDQLAQSDNANGVNDPAALPGGLRKPRAFQGGEMEQRRGGRLAEPFGNFTGRNAVRPCLDEQTQHAEACFLREGTKNLGGVSNSTFPV